MTKQSEKDYKQLHITPNNRAKRPYPIILVYPMTLLPCLPLLVWQAHVNVMFPLFLHEFVCCWDWTQSQAYIFNPIVHEMRVNTEYENEAIGWKVNNR